ncbi:MAG: thioredoxin domain-containing protein [Bryobacteraceae bacterium]
MKVCALALVALSMAGAAVPGLDPNQCIGTPSAPVTLEIFSDFECPACKVFHENVLPELMRDYVIPGKVFVASFEFPLPMHQYSRQAADYAVAAARVGMYMPVADALFRGQQSWSVSGKVWAAVAGVLNPAQQKRVQALAEDPGVLAEIRNEIDIGHRVPVNETPTIVVIRGARNIPITGGLIRYQFLKQLLDDLIQK